MRMSKEQREGTKKNLCYNLKTLYKIFEIDTINRNMFDGWV